VAELNVEDEKPNGKTMLKWNLKIYILRTGGGWK
jgi:hypothetical protein